MRGAQIIVSSKPLVEYLAGPVYFPPDITIQKAGIYTIVNANDFMVKWDGSTRVYITVSSALKGLTKGLCGNNDDDITNDKITSQGILSNEWSIVADSWKQSANCPDSIILAIDENNPCSGKETRQAWAHAKCSAIIDNRPESPFSSCNTKIEQTIAQNFYMQCIYDSCK